MGGNWIEPRCHPFKICGRRSRPLFIRCPCRQDMVAYSDAFFPTHPLRLAGICQLSETLYLIIGKCPCCLSPLPPPWLYARESGCVFYPIGVIPHVAAGSPKTIICLFVSAKLFPDLKILQIFIAEISSP